MNFPSTSLAPALKQAIGRLIEPAVRNARYFERRLIGFSAMAIVCFPLYWYVWHDLFPQPYENLTLRLIGTALFVPLLFSRDWPAGARKYLPLYWYGALLFGLPFFFTFMTLKNGGSEVWVESLLIAVFVMVLLLDWVTLIVHAVLGTALAWIAYAVTTDAPLTAIGHVEYLPIVVFAVVIGAISNYGVEVVRMEQERAMLATAGSIAHELRTPLLGISTGAEGLRSYLPVLLDAYRLGREAGLPVAVVRTAHLDAMSGVLDRIVAEANHSNAIIDMLLVNARHGDGTAKELVTCSIAHCVDTALRRYPFTDSERPLVAWERRDDFTFRGTELLTVHVLFNLIKNALRQIAKSGKGRIAIATIAGRRENLLVFRDTAAGIPAAHLPHIFNRFYTSTGSDSILGAGIGLAFCRDVMRTFGGDIDCTSQPGDLTEFVLTFPKP